MNIAFYCAEGSASFIFTPKDVTERGVGGAELSLIDLTTTLAKLGHTVTVYNQPPEEGTYDGVEYVHTDAFNPFEPLDVFILYRNPFPENLPLFPYIKAPKIFLSTDQQTAGEYSVDIFPYVDHTVCISEYHKRYFVRRYGIDPSKITVIDLGVRTWEYEQSVDKIPNSLLYCSIPDRGLEHLARFFPLIRKEIPDAILRITSSYALWGYGIPDSNERFRKMFEGMAGVEFLSKIPRQELVRIQQESQILAYPNQPVGDFTELFGVSVAEAQVAGCIPITSSFGAFETTVISNAMLVMDDDNFPLHPQESSYGKRFVSMIVRLLKNKNLDAMQREMSVKARIRFDWKNIASQWLGVIERVRREKEGVLQ